MSLPRFFDRVADATLRLLGNADREVLEEHLTGVIVRFMISDDRAALPGHEDGFLLAVNLGARIYPAIQVEAPEPLLTTARSEVLRVNPACELVDDAPADAPALAWGLSTPGVRCVSVDAAGWDVTIGGPYSAARPSVPLAAMAAGAIGAGELFRLVLAPLLGSSSEPAPATEWNLITGGASPTGLPEQIDELDVGRVVLAGCGAVGQAFALALASVKPVGVLIALDRERLKLSNVQRYVLAGDEDEDADKTALVARAFEATGMEVSRRDDGWSGSFADAGDRVVVALDTADDRIRVQAGLPKVIFNAFTGERELGVSRHERFGDEPCLACLYWPLGTKPLPEHVRIGNSLGEHPERILAYVVSQTAVSDPLPPEILVTGAGRMPATAVDWGQRSLLDDLSDRFGLNDRERSEWHGRDVRDLYRRGVCGGALVAVASSKVARDHIQVPQAHQSALAGILLAVELVAACHPALQNRRRISASLRLPAGSVGPPLSDDRRRTPRCLCADPDFLARWAEKWVR